MRRVGFTGRNESAIEIMVRLPPYWLMPMTASSPTSKARITSQPNTLPPKLSAAALNAVTGSAFGEAADMIAPRTNTQIPEIALGRYVHQKLDRTPTLAGR